MSVSPRPIPRYTRLRDFGAFQVDVSTLETQEMAIVQERVPPANIMAFPIQEVTSGVLRGGKPLSGGMQVARPQVSPMLFFPKSLDRGDPCGRPSKLGQKITAKKWINLAIRMALTLLLFIFLLRSLSWSTLFAALAHVRHGIVLVGLTVGAFGIVVSSYQWRSLLRAEKIRSDLAVLIDLYMVGVAFSHFLPTGMGGDAVKALYVGREAGNNAGAASAVVMSRVTGFFGMLLIALPVLLIWHEQFAPEVVVWFVLLSLVVGSMIGISVGVTILLPELSQGRWATHRIFTSAMRIGNALSLAMRRPRFLGVATLFGVQFWVVGCLNYYSYAIALGLNVPLYFYFVAIPLVSLVTFLPISINGFGLRESAFVSVFSTIHVPIATSLLLALLMDVQVLFFGAIGGCIYLMMGGNAKKAG